MIDWIKTLLNRRGAEAQSGAAGAQVGEGATAAGLLQAYRDEIKRLQWRLERETNALERAAEKIFQLSQPFPVVDGEEEAWSVAHQEAWLQFLKKTEAGQVLLAKVNFQEQAMNRSAVLRTEGAENNTGFARGWHAASQYFFKALPISADVRPQQDEDTDSGAGAAHLRERLAP